MNNQPTCCEKCRKSLTCYADPTRRKSNSGGSTCSCHTKKPEPTCVCGEPNVSDRVVHRTDGPCYIREPEPTLSTGWEAEYRGKLRAYDVPEHRIDFFLSEIRQLLTDTRTDERRRIAEAVEDVFDLQDIWTNDWRERDPHEVREELKASVLSLLTRTEDKD